jgi:prolyl 4-hydroxylase
VPEPDISFEDGTTSNTPETYEQYRALCRGETLYRAPAVLSSLVCQYRRGVLPYSVYREEVVSWTPRISIYHNIISHHEAAQIKDIVHKKLQKSPAMVGGYKDTVLTRRSQHLWDQLLANGHYNVTFLSQRVADMTGLDTRFSYKSTASDPWSISDYGIGGQFEPHVDYYEDAEDLDKNLPDYMVGSGDRIITSVFYLSTPKAGGGTVFPWVNVTVNAVEGNAAVWYNYHPSGEPDWDTRHAGCPVLLGEKWVAIKWVRQTAQWATKPCGLTQQEAWPRQ